MRKRRGRDEEEKRSEEKRRRQRLRQWRKIMSHTNKEVKMAAAGCWLGHAVLTT